MTNGQASLYTDWFDKGLGSGTAIVILNDGSHYTLRKMQGSIQVYASQSSTGSLHIRQIEKLSLWTFEIDSIPRLILSGPTFNNSWQIETGQAGQVSRMRFLLTYPELTQQEPVIMAEDAAFSPREIMQGQLNWTPGQNGEFPYTQFELSLALQFDHRVVGRIVSLHFISPKLFILDGNQNKSTVNADMEATAKKLHLRFIKTPSRPYNSDDTKELPSDEDLKKNYLLKWLNGVNNVWNRYGGVWVDIKPVLVSPPKEYNYKFKKAEEEPHPSTNIKPLKDMRDEVFTKKVVDEDDTTLDVFLINTLPDSFGGGQGFGVGVPDLSTAFIVLQVDGNSKENCNLLAHELGHVIGLQHPDYFCPNESFWRGAEGSVMESSGVGNPNPGDNPPQNLYAWRHLIDPGGNRINKMIEDSNPPKASSPPTPEKWYLWISEDPLPDFYDDCDKKKRDKVYPPPIPAPIPYPKILYILFRLSEYQVYKPVHICLYHYFDRLDPLLEHYLLPFPDDEDGDANQTQRRTCSYTWEGGSKQPPGDHVIYAVIVGQNTPTDLKGWTKNPQPEDKSKLENWADTYPHQNYVKRYEFTIQPEIFIASAQGDKSVSKSLIPSTPEVEALSETLTADAIKVESPPEIPITTPPQKKPDYILNCDVSAAQENDWTAARAIEEGVLDIHSDLPDGLDLRRKWWKIENQKETGACVGFATTAVLRWHFTKAGKMKPYQRLSARFIWMAAKETDELIDFATTFLESEGAASIKPALKIAKKFGCVPAKNLPIKGGLSKLTRGEFYSLAGEKKIAGYYNLDRDNIEIWRRWLALRGPIIVRLQVDDTWFNPPEGGHLQTYLPSEEKDKGHAVCLVGYNHPEKFFIVRNSWGTGWGDNGFAYASYEYATAAFTEAYGVVL